MPYLVPSARIALGLVFVVFGLDFFLHFFPEEGVEMTEAGGAFLEAIYNTGYLFQLIKSIEVCSGLLLLSGFLTPLALTLLAPVVLNIALYHLLLDPNGLPLAMGILALELFLLWSYRGAFGGILALRTRPEPGSGSSARRETADEVAS